MKRKAWKKILHDRRSRKLVNKKYRRDNCRCLFLDTQTTEEISGKSSIYKEATKKLCTAPKEFSLIHNPAETIEFFNKIQNIIKNKIHGTKISIDSSGVKEVTVDALIYLIAIMENMKINREEEYAFFGNAPIEKEARNVYENSGFVDYINSRGKSLPQNGRYALLRTGNRNMPSVTKGICDFVIEKLGVEKKDVSFIQKILVELMSNTYNHAYPEEISDMDSKWYAYVEHVNNTIRVIFVDTGKGITGTVRRKLSEKIRTVFGTLNDSELLFHALQPDNFIRTETKESNRGRGIPGIKEDMDNSPVDSFWIFSGSGAVKIVRDGICEIDLQRDLTNLDFKHKIYGTIYAFEFSKERMQRKHDKNF